MTTLFEAFIWLFFFFFLRLLLGVTAQSHQLPFRSELSTQSPLWSGSCSSAQPYPCGLQQQFGEGTSHGPEPALPQKLTGATLGRSAVVHKHGCDEGPALWFMSSHEELITELASPFPKGIRKKSNFRLVVCFHCASKPIFSCSLPQNNGSVTPSDGSLRGPL